MAGERSGLFFEIIRLVDELRPRFVFLENVPAITVRGLDRVAAEFTGLRYDCRWTIVSAADVGAPHLRKRWFMLAWRADGDGDGCEIISQPDGQESKLDRQSGHDIDGLCDAIPNADSIGFGNQRQTIQSSHSKIGLKSETWLGNDGKTQSLADATSAGWAEGRTKSGRHVASGSWWETEPDVGRVVDELSFRVDRLRCLGNAVVPIQAQEAFKRLAGLR